MNRRRFLGLIGMSATAGCASQSESEISSSESETTTPSSCPSFPGDRAGQTVCDGKQRDVPVYLRAKGDTVAAKEGTINFAFVNTASRDVSYGPCFWTLYTESSNGWQVVHPIRGDAIGKRLPAGSSHELTLRIGVEDTTEPENCNPYVIDELDAGRHLFGIQGHTPDGTTTLFLASFHANQ